MFSTSRFIPEIMEYFKEGTVAFTIKIEVRDDDVRKSLEGRLGQLPKFVARETALQKEIIMEISQCIDVRLASKPCYFALTLGSSFSPSSI